MGRRQRERAGCLSRSAPQDTGEGTGTGGLSIHNWICFVFWNRNAHIFEVNFMNDSFIIAFSADSPRSRSSSGSGSCTL